ncbi:MAG TPA: hypothetical protein GXX29_04575 [Firmicutes bacterium]|nr:hypothetical protein [Bacillota bacterium]
MSSEVVAGMRMDNETYRLKVENLFTLLPGENGSWRQDIQSELEHLALSARKGRYFLRVVSTQPRPVQLHFYGHYMARSKNQDAFTDLERHIRHMFYESREEAKEMLAALVKASTLPAIFRVIALTEEGWLAGELIRIVLSADIKELRPPIKAHLHSNDYLLQCLAIYLIGKLGDEELLQSLADFYRKPEGDKVDRLEKKAYDALIEGGRMASLDRILRWLRDKNARIREMALTLVGERMDPEAVTDLVKLVLIDPKTGPRAAGVLLSYEQAGIISWDRRDEKSARIRSITATAKQEALINTFRHILLRHENPVVREVAAKMARLIPAAVELGSQLRRLVTEDHAASVQIAALWTLADIDREKMMTALIELFSADAPGREATDAANLLMDTLTPEEVHTIKEGISRRMERRQAALDRFAASVEWWRHDT